MHVDDLVLVNVDDHVIALPHLFRDHLPAALLPEAFQLMCREDGSVAAAERLLNPVNKRMSRMPSATPMPFTLIRSVPGGGADRSRDCAAGVPAHAARA
jgi:hypothetical protein